MEKEETGKQVINLIICTPMLILMVSEQRVYILATMEVLLFLDSFPWESAQGNNFIIS